MIFVPGRGLFATVMDFILFLIIITNYKYLEVLEYVKKEISGRSLELCITKGRMLVNNMSNQRRGCNSP